MRYDKIHEGDGFLIYGAGLLGRQICDNLLDAGLHVYGFLDNSSFVTPSYRGVDILPYSQAHSLPQAQKDAVVVISLINPFDHEKIKDSLLSKGFSRIICKRDILKKETAYQVNALYDKIASFHGNFRADTILGATFEMWDPYKNHQEDQGIINRQNGYVAAYIPIELIHAVGKPVIMQTQVIKLFECFQGKNTDGVELFWEYVYKAQANLPKSNLAQEKQRIIGGRLKVYQNMVHALSLDTDFFCRHPVTVSRNNGVFNIKDGMHRTLFLYIHGFRLIPCIMPEQQYDTWVAAKRSDISTQNALTPILHPYYYLDRTSYENVYETRVDTILRFLASENTENLTAFDFGNNNGWIARNLCRSGIKTTCLLTGEDRDIITDINHLEDVSMTLTSQIPANQTFDIVTDINLKCSNPAILGTLNLAITLSSQYVFVETDSLAYFQDLNLPYQVLRKSYEPELNFRYLSVIMTKDYVK